MQVQRIYLTTNKQAIRQRIRTKSNLGGKAKCTTAGSLVAVERRPSDVSPWQVVLFEVCVIGAIVNRVAQTRDVAFCLSAVTSQLSTAAAARRAPVI